MRCLLLVVFLAGCAAPSGADEPEGGVKITIAAARVAECQASGGCGLVSLSQLKELQRGAFNEGTKAAFASLDANGCRRGMI